MLYYAFRAMRGKPELAFSGYTAYSSIHDHRETILGMSAPMRYLLGPCLACLFSVATCVSLAATAGEAASPTTYRVDLSHPESHLVGVTLTVPEAHAHTEIQFPAWNALYQIRDFVRHVQNLQAQCGARPTTLIPEDRNTWSSERACAPLVVRYEVYADEPGVFSSELIPDHAFLNLAEVLFYIPDRRHEPAQVQFILPPSWKLVTLMPEDSRSGEYVAPSYDALVDSPVEAGEFQMYSFSQGKAVYRVAVRGNPADYSSARLLDSIAKITAAETALMRDVPFSRYTFIFHFSETDGGGGMEHGNGTAISFPATQLQDNWKGLESTIAHEFFHLWNVKRIRPQGLEPIDYIHGNDTRDLWFSEGVTSTYARLALLRAGLVGRQEFYEHLAQEIHELQRRPARHFQSVEVAGMDAWLEKYPDYGRPERSISYYNKGELLGYLLDLGIRHFSENRHSLDDLMRLLNQNFARQHRYFTDENLERLIASLAPPASWVHNFFRQDIAGTAELDYEKYLAYAGLKLVTEASTEPDWGFQAARNFEGLIQVAAVDPESNAAHAGLENGDVLMKINGQVIYALPQDILGVKPGEKVSVQVRRGPRWVTLRFNLGKRQETEYRVEEVLSPSPQQLAIRTGWLEGKTSGLSVSEIP
jgi:predicted metalloprotease with PDZ domain